MQDQMDKNWKEFLHDFFVISLCGILVFLPIKVHYANIGVGTAVFLWLIQLKDNIRRYSQSYTVPLIVFTAVFWIVVLGLAYTENYRAGFSILEKKLGLLILPLVIITSNLSREDIKKIFFSLFAGVLLALAICYFRTFHQIALRELSPLSILNTVEFQNLAFSKHIPIHPAYLSNLILLCVFFFLQWYSDYSVAMRIVGVIVCLLFGVTLIILGARAAILALAIIVPGLALYKSIESGRWRIFVIAVSAFVLTAVVLFSTLPSLRQRFFESFESYNEMVTNNDQWHSIPTHAKVWHCAMRANEGIAIIFGQGTGDEVDRLRTCFVEMKWDVLAGLGMDSHNEYLSNYVRYGLVGVLVFITALAYGFYLAIKYRTPSYLAFMILIAVSALSESILRGQLSLLTYVFFNACFAKYCIIDAQREDRKAPSTTASQGNL